MLKWLQAMVSRSRHRAGRANFAHDLAADHAERLFQQQGGRCAISGLPFTLVQIAGVLVKHPFAPSLNRISSHGGYTVDNVRLVCIAVNFGMEQWGEELYLTFARAAVEHSNKMNLPAASARGVGSEAAAWHMQQCERIAAAEAIASTMSGSALATQRRRIASLKRNMALGPAGLKAAAAKALRTRGMSS